MDVSRAGDVLDALGDERSREILAALSEQSRSAKALSAALDVSLPTVYRRLDALEECGLVTTRTAMDGDGNHYQRYVCALSELSVALDDGEYDVDVEHGGDAADRFSDLWSSLRRED
ncbi:MAG: ArsR/SmtB family transcription factor [Halarchaeum sp.]